MQPDRRLIQHIQHAGQSGADLTRQPDALRFTARQRRRSARQRQIIQPDIDQKPQPVHDFPQYPPGDFLPLRRQLRQHPGKPFQRIADRKLRRLGDIFASHPDGQGLGLQPGAVADRAGFLGLIPSHFLAHPDAVGFLPAPLQVLQHAFERFCYCVAAHAIFVGERDWLLGAEQDRVAHVFRQFVPGRFRCLLEVPGEALQGLVVVWRLRAGPRHDRPVRQARAIVRHHQFGIEKAFDAQPVAGRTGAMRRIEAEQPGFDFLDRKSTDRTGELGGEYSLFPAIGVLGVHHAVRHAQRCFETIRQPGGDAVAHHQTVHHRLDLMLGLAVQGRDIGDFIQRAVHFDPGEAAPLQFRQFLAVFALAVAHHGRQQQQACALWHRHHAVHHLGHGLRFDRQPGRRGIRHADPGPQQAHVVGDFGHRADGGAGVLRRRLLFDRNGRRQSFDTIDIGLSHQFQELPGVGGQGLDVPALALGVDRIERQRGFPRP